MRLLRDNTNNMNKIANRQLRSRLRPRSLLNATFVMLLAIMAMFFEGLPMPILMRPALAHPIYMDHIEHHVEVVIGQINIDVNIVLRFNEVQSLMERRKMDLNHDNIISPTECDEYLRRAADSLRRANAFRLTCDGQPLDLMPLYEPRLDLLGVASVSPKHHELRLSYFARTPVTKVLSAEEPTTESTTEPTTKQHQFKLIFEDFAWPTVPALWMFTATAKDDLNVTVLPTSTSVPPIATPSTSASSAEPSSSPDATAAILAGQSASVLVSMPIRNPQPISISPATARDNNMTFSEPPTSTQHSPGLDCPHCQQQLISGIGIATVMLAGIMIYRQLRKRSAQHS